MVKNGGLRRSRSWRDISLFNKMGLSKDSLTVVPAVPLNGTSSVGRPRARTDAMNRNTQYTGSRIWGETPVSVTDQRAKEIDFRRRASISRKAVPSGVLDTTTTSSQVSTDSSASRRPSTAPQTSQLPAFTFSTKAFEKSPASTSVLPPPHVTPVAHSHRQSVSAFQSKSHVKSGSVSAQRSMVSEMSVPMILDFDLARHQRNPSQATMSGQASGLNFGFTAEIVQTPLTDEEKQHLINSIPPIHIVSLPNSSSSNGSSPKLRRGSSLKRFFGLRKTDRSPSPSKSNKHARSASTKHPLPPSTPLATPSQEPRIPNFEGANARTIYARPYHAEYKRDMVPRLTVQIPDSTMDRASKIFQSIYSAHAAALQQVTSTHERNESWGYPTPVSTTSTGSIATMRYDRGYDIPATVEGRVSRFSRDHRPAPRPSQRMSRDITITPISRSQSPATRITARSSSIIATPISRSHSPATRNSLLITTPIPRSQSPAKRNSRTMKASKHLSAFPVPPMNTVRGSAVDLSDVESEMSEDWDEDEDEDEWEKRSVKGSGIKEPEWEMLTPAPIARSIIV